MGFKEAFAENDITQEEMDMITKKANQSLLDIGYSQEVIDDAYKAMELDYMGLPNFVYQPTLEQYLEAEYSKSKHAKYSLEGMKLKKAYIDNWRMFSGKLMTGESIAAMPESLEKDHIKAAREMLITEGFNPDEFRVDEIPIEGVYYFEKAIQERGVDYFSLTVEEDGTLKPQYTTLECDENGWNTFPCNTIRESIDKHEC